MKKQLFPLMIALLPWICLAQVNDDFGDGDFTLNPVWQGNQEHFKINDAFQLQLDQEGLSDTSYLQTPNQILDSVSWEFFIKLSFSPSSNNFARVYLVADQMDLSGELNGYFLQFGESLSNDAIELFRQNGSQITSICRGMEGNIASSFNARIKVQHRNNGDWLVYADFNNTGQYTLECQGRDQSIQASSYFGFFCKYTSSNATHFYFDEVAIKHYDVDEEAPRVNSVLVSAPNELMVSFNEVVTEETAEDLQNYSVNTAIGNPSTAILGENHFQVKLGFAEAFELDYVYQVSIKDIADLSQNTLIDTTVDFSRINISAFDIVINEIMADPSPVVQLADAEYLEIYNRTTASIPLKDWNLEIGGSLKAFPDVILQSHSYLILCKEAHIPLFTEWGPCAGFSSFSLTNGGQSLRLLAPGEMEIHAVEYTDEWYHDPDKDDGGWSMEQINPSDFCSEEMNWKASNDARGGSPGMQNSVNDPEPVYPIIEGLEVIDNPLLLVFYNQEMELEDILDRSHYGILPGQHQAQQVIIHDSSRSVYLLFSEPFEIGVQYHLRVNGTLVNCVGQTMETPFEITFMLPKTAEEGEIVINEIMADPEPVNGLPPYEYIELYNRANAPVEICGWNLQTGNVFRPIEEFLMAPQSYLLLCENEATGYLREFSEVYGMSSFSLTNAGAQLVLRNQDGGIIHQVEYQDDWYEDEEKEDGGWSLEAIDPSEYCLEQANWAASTDERGGSPGSLNSVNGIANPIEELYIKRIELLSESSIRVYFSDKMDSVLLAQEEHYQIDQGLGMPLECIIEGPKYQSVQLLLPESLERGQVYTLEIQEGLWACDGSSAAGINQVFAYPDPIEKGDVVFNEVLFNAAIDDGEYIEFVNVSSKIIETADLSISRLKINQYDSTWYTADIEGGLLFPMDYVAYSPSPMQVLKVYQSENPDRIVPLVSLPDLPNTEGHLLLHLSSSQDSIIDELLYDESMHHSLIKDPKGVSLEKIDLYGTHDAFNFHSAASSVNYGTPAYQNSQYVEEMASKSAFELSPEIFSPDNDGHEDILQIHYQMDENGYQLNLIIYDSRGRKIKHLIQNELLGTEGVYFWDGQDEEGQKASMGIYILLFEYFDLKGKVKTEKLTTVLGGKL